LQVTVSGSLAIRVLRPLTPAKRVFPLVWRVLFVRCSLLLDQPSRGCI